MRHGLYLSLLFSFTAILCWSQKPSIQQGHAQPKSATLLQKKPLDHSVYDQWESIRGKALSRDGKWLVYAAGPKKGDGKLYIKNTNGHYIKLIERGENICITEDSRFLIFQIKPLFKDVEDARIKKKSPEERPKDTLALLELGKDAIVYLPGIKSYKLPSEGASWLAYQLNNTPKEKAPADNVPAGRNHHLGINEEVDSLRKVIDSLMSLIQIKEEGGNNLIDKTLALEPLPPKGRSVPGTDNATDLVLRNLMTGEEKIFPDVYEYVFDKKGTKLLMTFSTGKKKGSVNRSVGLYDLDKAALKILLTHAHDVKSLTLDEKGTQVAFVAQMDSSEKAIQKFYKLYYYSADMDSALLKADRFTPGMKVGFTVSTSGKVQFSKNGRRLFFEVQAIRPPKDTSLIESELAQLDIWNYQDDYLQPQQLKSLNKDLERSFISLVKEDGSGVLMLGDADLESVTLIDEGNAPVALGRTTIGGRKQSQWLGKELAKYYLIDLVNGKRTLVKENITYRIYASPSGRYLHWFDTKARQYFAYAIATGIVKNISAKIPTVLYDDEDDQPDDPVPFGMGLGIWTAGDEDILVRDRYDIWKLNPDARKAPVNITNSFGRKNKIILEYIKLDSQARYISKDAELLLSGFNRVDKNSGYFRMRLDVKGDPEQLVMGPYDYDTPLKARDTTLYMLTKGNTMEFPDLYISADLKVFKRVSALNSQQQTYNWLTVELVRWKMLDGKMAEGRLYKPENFDPKKKYPLIFYFYDRHADELHHYLPPVASASIINIPYFVSNGYIVFDPNIYYKIGEPGESAYNSIVSAAKYLSGMSWVDPKKMGIQGQSWGGYQVAYLVTRTNLFAAASAGAPVANMTSAYGGIRWGTGVSREFQYERAQSRIGATLWQRPDLYIKNSPLFKADKVNTPLLIMHNDQDGAVPWYQGIEYFTALKRLGKKVWMLQYNGEDHNLQQDRNKKDLSIRLAQFFDHFLKGTPAPQWIKSGVPAVDKGKNWGLE